MIADGTSQILQMGLVKEEMEEKRMQAFLVVMDAQEGPEIQGGHIIWMEDFGYNGKNGTGGLLIIYTSNLQNNKIIKSNGTGTHDAIGYAAGGSSGGGSVNIFYNNSCNNSGTIEAKGGKAGNGGSGGDGTVTIGKISNGTFVKDEN